MDHLEKEVRMVILEVRGQLDHLEQRASLAFLDLLDRPARKVTWDRRAELEQMAIVVELESREWTEIKENQGDRGQLET